MQEGHFDFGLIGLGVMGRNFILNIAEKGFSTVGLDMDEEKVNALLKEDHPGKIHATTSASDFVNSLAKPRKIMFLVPAGAAVDSVIENLIPLLDEGDLLIDGGNSHFEDTERRIQYLKDKGLHYLGTGISGGAEGARFGPSIMPGGDEKAYEMIKPLFEAAAAKIDGQPCVAFIGQSSAGNYVKMVHNGIEYGLMQLIAESYHLLKVTGRDNLELSGIFGEWNQGPLQSFLIEITSKIFSKRDEFNDEDNLVDKILDKARQKGTGKWTSQNAFDLGIPTSIIDTAVTLRGISALKDDREVAEKLYNKPIIAYDFPETEEVEKALYFAFLLTYVQGFELLRHASEEFGYGLKLPEIAGIWRGGCIIRAELLELFRGALNHQNPLLNQDLSEIIDENSSAARSVISFAVMNGIPMPAHASALSYFDSITLGKLPLNLVQAQRDFFGAHTYERNDRDGVFTSQWD